MPRSSRSPPASPRRPHSRSSRSRAGTSASALGVGNLGKSGQDLTGLTNAKIDDTDTTYTVRGGYRFHPNFAVELGYYDLGKYAFSGTAGDVDVSGSAKAKSYGISLVGIAPMGQLRALRPPGLGGVGDQGQRQHRELHAERVGQAERRHLRHRRALEHGHKNIGLFAEWMKNDKIEVDSYLVGVDFRF